MSDELTVDESWRSDKAHEVICDAAELIANCYCSEDDTFETEKRRLTVAISRVADRADLKMEEALKELRDMFRGLDSEIIYHTRGTVRIAVWEPDAIPRTRVRKTGSTLSEAMSQVRAFKQSQEQER